MSEWPNALSSVENLEGVISSKIEEIGSTLGWAEFKASDAADTIETVQSQVVSLVREARKQTQRLRAIVRKRKTPSCCAPSLRESRRCR